MTTLLTGCSQKTKDTQVAKKEPDTVIDFKKLSKKDQAKVEVATNHIETGSYNVTITNNLNRKISVNLGDFKLNKSTKFSTNVNKIQLNPKEKVYIDRMFAFDDKIDEQKNTLSFGNTRIAVNPLQDEQSESNSTKKVIYIDDARRIHEVDASDTKNKSIDLSNLKESDWVKGIPPFLNGTYRSEYLGGKYIMLHFNRAKMTWNAYTDPSESNFHSNFAGFDPSYYQAKENKSVYFMRDMKSKEPMYMKFINLGNNTFMRGPIMGELKDDSENKDTYKYQVDNAGDN